MLVKTNFQLARPNLRPDDASLQKEEMFLDISTLPQIGDHIQFSKDNAGEQGIFKVRSRLFSFSLDSGKYFVSFVNIVVEDDIKKYQLLVHE